MNHRRINGNFWQEWRLLRYRCRYSCSDTTLLSFSCEENCLSFWLTVGFSSKSIALTGEQTKVEFRILGGHSAHHNSNIVLLQFGSVQSLSRVRLFAIPWTEAHQASLSITNSQSLLKLMHIESVMPPNHLILCRPLLLLPSVFPSVRVFSNESALLIRWPKDWSFSFSISPSNEHSGLISFRMVWSLCSPRDSQESSLTPQFKSINSLVLSFLYSPTLTSIHDHWKNHSLD